MTQQEFEKRIETLDNDYEKLLWWIFKIGVGVGTIIFALYYDPLKHYTVINHTATLFQSGLFPMKWRFYINIGRIGLIILGLSVAFQVAEWKMMRYWFLSGILVIISYYSYPILPTRVAFDPYFLVAFIMVSLFLLGYLRLRHGFTMRMLKKIQLLYGLDNPKAAMEKFIEDVGHPPIFKGQLHAYLLEKTEELQKYIDE